MNAPNASPASILDVWDLYEQAISQETTEKGTAALSQAQTALFRYTLPGWGLAPLQGKSFTQQEKAAAKVFMGQLPMEQLSQAAIVQQEVFNSLQLPLKTQRTYRSALNQFLAWCERQEWCYWTAMRPSLSHHRPQKKAAARVHVTDRRRTDEQGQKLYDHSYGLGRVEGDQIPEALQRELDAFYQFRTNPNQNWAVKAITARAEVEQIKLVLGWLHRQQHVAVEELCLRQLVPLVTPLPQGDLGQKQPVRSVFEVSSSLIEAYLSWLQQASPSSKTSTTPRSQSTHTHQRFLRLLKVIAGFVYGKYPSQLEVTSQVATIPSTPSINEAEQKTLTWEQVESLVEVLRYQCQPRLSYDSHTAQGGSILGPIRDLSAIAFSYQRFLALALMTYLEPRRAVYYWGLLMQSPESLTQEYEYSGYLLQENEQWFIYWPEHRPRSLKLAQFECIEVPNCAYDDSRCFYDYLCEWLTDYLYRDSQIEGLRSVFNPQHPYFFTKRNGQPYERANEFKYLLRTSAYQHLGKVPTLENIRQAYKNREKEHHSNESTTDFPTEPSNKS